MRRSTEARPERKRERLTYWAYRTAERVIGALPRGLVLRIAAAAGNAAYDASAAKRALIHENLGLAMGLPPDDPRVARAGRQAFRNYAK